MNVRHQGAARRYARALLEVAQDKGGADGLRDALRQAVDLLAQHHDLSAALTHPALAAERKQAIAREVFRQQGADDTLLRLLERYGATALQAVVNQGGVNVGTLANGTSAARNAGITTLNTEFVPPNTTLVTTYMRNGGA